MHITQDLPITEHHFIEALSMQHIASWCHTCAVGITVNILQHNADIRSQLVDAAAVNAGALTLLKHACCAG